MRILDRYVVRNFLISVLLCFVVLMSIRIVADLFLNLDDFTKPREREDRRTALAVVADIGTYYGYRSLTYFRELGGIIVVAAAAFTLWRMNHTNELTAILASGVSLHRVLLPIILGAVCLNALVVLDTELLIPKVKYQLVASRDDPTGSEAMLVRLLTDGNNSSWLSRQFLPAEGRLTGPLIILRDENLAYCGHITGPRAVYSSQHGGWLFSPTVTRRHAEPERQASLQVPGWKQAPTTSFIPTHIGPKEIIDDARGNPANKDTNWSKAVIRPKLEARPVDSDQPASPLKLSLAAGVLDIRDERNRPVSVAQATPACTYVLEGPTFVYTRDGKPLATFIATRAVYENSPQQQGWALREGKLLYTSDLTPGDLSLRQSSDWLGYMSTAELNGLLRLQQAPDPDKANLVRHSRFADFFNNVIMLLVAVPFILSRERNIKASAGLTVLMVGVVFVFIYLSRSFGLPPVLAAWLPILTFGPVATYMLDAVKT